MDFGIFRLVKSQFVQLGIVLVVMAERIENVMDLDLNLGPVAPASPVIGPGTGPSSGGESVNLDAWIEPPLMSIREALRQRTRQRWRWRHLQIPLDPNAFQLTVDSDGSSENPGGPGSGGDGEGSVRTLQTGEGSVAPEERSHEPAKTCENHVNLAEKDSVDGEEDVEKTGTEGGSFFDCNICLDLAKEPVVTCCGHLFCWPCIYCWLNNYCEANECPVCKGEVTFKNLTPIYGRGDHTRETEEDSGVNVPARPSGRRVESLRQTIHRTASAFPMEEMIRRLGARFELTRDFFQLPEADSSRDPLERSSMLNRFLTSRALQREQTPAIPPEHVVDLTHERPEIMHRRLPPLTYRRGQSHRGSSGLTSVNADRIVEAYLRRSPPRRSQEQQPPSMDDRDSFSSIAAVIHGESQTMDTAVEIDSMVSLSTSSSRRRNVAARASDMDSGDSRAPRRRRLQ